MGVSGHIGLAFDPADEAAAIAAVNGEDTDDNWLRYQTEFGLTGENFAELDRVLRRLAVADPTLAPLADAVFGGRKIGEGPTHPIGLYTADEVRQMADAFRRVGEAVLVRAIGDERADAIEVQWFPADLSDAFRRVGRELDHVATNGWSLIAFIC